MIHTQTEQVEDLTNLTKLHLGIQQLNKEVEQSCGLSLVQWHVLSNLVRMPATSPQLLANTIGITPGSLTQTLARLENKKWLFICEDSRDARKKMVSITRLGKQTVVNAEKIYEKKFEELFKNKLEIATLAKALKNFSNI